MHAAATRICCQHGSEWRCACLYDGRCLGVFWPGKLVTWASQRSTILNTSVWVSTTLSSRAPPASPSRYSSATDQTRRSSSLRCSSFLARQQLSVSSSDQKCARSLCQSETSLLECLFWNNYRPIADYYYYYYYYYSAFFTPLGVDNNDES